MGSRNQKLRNFSKRGTPTSGLPLELLLLLLDHGLLLLIEDPDRKMVRPKGAQAHADRENDDSGQHRDNFVLV